MIHIKKFGVDINAGNELVQQIKQPIKNTFNDNVLTDLGGFAGLFSLPKDISNPTLVACTDGVGTKVSLAFNQQFIAYHWARFSWYVR